MTNQTPPIRIFHLIKGLGRGGAETLLAEGHRHAGRDFEYAYGYFLPHKAHLSSQLEHQGASVFQFPARTPAGLLLRLPSLIRTLRGWKPDLLHTHLPLTGFLGRLAGRVLDLPVVYTEHNLIGRYHPLTRWLHFRAWEWQDRVIAVSREVAASIERAGSVVPIHVVHNGVSIDRLRFDATERARARQELGIAADAPVLGTVGVFRAQKRLDHWLRVAADIRQRHPESRFLLVGDGPRRPELQRLVGELGLDEVTFFPGLQENVRPFYAAMDVFLLTSDYEGLPLALLEAMAMERPVVATAVGGVPEVVTPDRDGILVPPGQAPATVRAITALLAEPESRKRLGRSARATVETRFSQQRMVSELEALYRETLAARSSHAS